MKINNITLTAENVGSTSAITVTLSFRDPNNANPYRVKDIIGLDAEDITKKYYGKGVGQYGYRMKFYDLQLAKREIVAHIGLNPDWASDEDYSKLRDDLYRLVSSSRSGEITIRFKNDETVIAQIKGTVTKMEASYFERLPDVTLTLTCPDPMLYGPNLITVPVGSLNPSNTIITDALSTAPHGINLQVKLKHSGGLSICGPNYCFSVEYAGLINDIVGVENDAFGTKGKRVFYSRGGSSHNLADKIALDSIWPFLFPGENKFTINNGNWHMIRYTPAYWGV